MTYLDYNAGAPLQGVAADAIRDALGWAPANPSSASAAGRRLRRVLEHARDAVAASVGASPSEVVFTSGGTEAVTTALRSAILAAPPLPELVTTAAEHRAVLGAAEMLATEGRCRVHIVPMGRDGAWRVADVLRACSATTALVSVFSANNETGVSGAVQELRAVLPPTVRLHVDAVQSWGKLPIDAAAWGADYLSLSGHKIGAPSGSGVLIVKRGAPFSPLLCGGQQEGGRRAGTENVLGIVGLGAAARALPAWLEAMGAVARRRDALEGEALALGGVEVNGGGIRLPNTTNLLFRGVDAEELLVELDERGITASSGSACMSASSSPSHVLLAMGRSAQEASSSVRFSLGPGTTDEDVSATVSALLEVVPRLRAEISQKR